MTLVYLAFNTQGHKTLARHAGDHPVDLLVAYPELRNFQKRRQQYNVRTWCLDSGAFSAHHSNVAIDLREYVAAAKDSDASEVFGLDVIGKPEATRRNLEWMWEQGLAAIPTFHYGSPWAELAWCCEHADKVALGGMARERDKSRVPWIRQAFARAWPKRLHGFGAMSRPCLEAGPFHSVDATSWEMGPACFGSWAGFNGKRQVIPTRRARDYWIEVEDQLKLGRWAAWRWRKELAQLEAT